MVISIAHAHKSTLSKLNQWCGCQRNAVYLSVYLKPWYYVIIVCKTRLFSPLHYTDTLEAKQYCMLIFLIFSNIIHHTIVGKFDSTSMNILLDTFEITLFIYILTCKQTDTVIFPYLNNIIND